MSENKEFLEEEEFDENNKEETPEAPKKAKRAKISEAIKGDGDKATPKEEVEALDKSFVILYDKKRKITFDVKKAAWEKIKKEKAELDHKVGKSLPDKTVHPYAHVVEATEEQIKKYLKTHA